MFVVVNAFYLKAMRSKTGNVVSFKTVQEAKEFLKKYGLTEGGYNFIEVNSNMMFSEEELEELSRNVNNLEKAREFMIPYIADPEPKQWEISSENFGGVFRINRTPPNTKMAQTHTYQLDYTKKRCPFIIGDRHIKGTEYFSDYELLQKRIEQLKAPYLVEGERLYNPLVGGFYIPKVKIKVTDIMEDIFVDKQPLYKITSVGRENKSCCQIEYSAKFYKAVSVEEWEEYPYFDPKMLNSIQ